MKTLIVRATLLEEALGMTPGTPEAFTKFLEFRKAKLGVKAAQISDDKSEEELKALKFKVEEMKADNTEASVDVFPIDPETNNPVFWDYQIRGFFKDTMKALKDMLSIKKSKEGEDEAKTSALKKLSKMTVATVASFSKMPATWVDRGIFVGPRKVQIEMPADGKMGYCQRPLRVEKFPKDITSLKNSETVPAGSVIKFKVGILNDADEKYVLACLHYGFLRGFGEWRNSGKGRFKFDLWDGKKWVEQVPEFEQIFGFEEALPE